MCSFRSRSITPSEIPSAHRSGRSSAVRWSYGMGGMRSTLRISSARPLTPCARAFVLSNPHNPVGRVYTREELQRMGDICLKHNVFVIADEIHSDLIFPGHHHTVFASLGEAYAKNCAVCHAPSKTFNLAGLSFSCIMIPDETHRQRFDAMVQPLLPGQSHVLCPRGSQGRVGARRGMAEGMSCLYSGK